MFVAMDLLEELKPELLKADLAAVDRVEERLASEPRSSLAALARADKTSLSVFGRLALLLALERAAPEEEELATRAGQVKALLRGSLGKQALSRRRAGKPPLRPPPPRLLCSLLSRLLAPSIPKSPPLQQRLPRWQPISFSCSSNTAARCCLFPPPLPLSIAPPPAMSSSFMANVHAPLDPPAHGWFCPYCSTTNPVHDLTCAKCGSNGLAQGAHARARGETRLAHQQAAAQTGRAVSLSSKEGRCAHEATIVGSVIERTKKKKKKKQNKRNVA